MLHPAYVVYPASRRSWEPGRWSPLSVSRCYVFSPAVEADRIDHGMTTWMVVTGAPHVIGLFVGADGRRFAICIFSWVLGWQ
jgi:hypothetical protein